MMARMNAFAHWGLKTKNKPIVISTMPSISHHAHLGFDLLWRKEPTMINIPESRIIIPNILARSVVTSVNCEISMYTP